MVVNRRSSSAPCVPRLRRDDAAVLERMGLRAARGGKRSSERGGSVRATRQSQARQLFTFVTRAISALWAGCLALTLVSLPLPSSS